MAAKIIKLTKKDDLTSVIKQIKSLKDREIVFEIDDDSPLLKSSEGMKLMKKTGEVLGKEIKIETGDETGKLLAKKAGVLGKNTVIKASAKPRFSDIMIPKKRTVKKATDIVEQSAPRASVPVQSKFTKYEEPIMDPRPNSEGSRLEFEISKKSTKFSKIFILCLVILIAAVFGLAVLLPQADVIVVARAEPITRDFEVVVDRSVMAVNSSSLLIPGVAISKEVSITKSFPTTGEKVSGTKASGVVTIYNNTANTLTLKASTTTLIANGKNYSFVKDVSGIKPNGVANAGIQITAQNGGTDSNVPAGTRFQIVNAALGNQNVYAENPAAITGGVTGASTKILSQQDIDSATNVLMQDILRTAEEQLTSTNSVKIRVLDSGVKKEVLAKTANKNVGQETENFDMTMIAKVTGLGFREDDVTEVVVAKINEVLSDDKYLLDTAKQTYDASFKSITPEQTSGTLSVHFETVAAYKIDGDNLPKLLAGKTDFEIKEILLSKPEVDDVRVKFWPEWFVHKAPKFNGKIKITTELNQE